MFQFHVSSVSNEVSSVGYTVIGVSELTSFQYFRYRTARSVQYTTTACIFKRTEGGGLLLITGKDPQQRDVPSTRLEAGTRDHV